MKRRDFIRLISSSSPLLLLGGCSSLTHLYQHICSSCSPVKAPEVEIDNMGDFAETQSSHHHHGPISEEQLHDHSAKSIFFEQDFPDDVYVTGVKFEMLKKMAHKFSLVQSYVGQGNFNLLGFDEFIKYAEYAPGIGKLSFDEKAFLDELFYFDARNYGFHGDKIFHDLTDNLKRKDMVKVPYSGHFLHRGPSLALYEKCRQDIGESLILTSGVRGIAKQFHLFLVKAIETKGNMSKASRSLAPPGYSFHGRGDFDVGKVGHGLKNFTDDFSKTDEYKRLIDLGYVNIRYTESNLLGVRFEPWHIKVV